MLYDSTIIYSRNFKAIDDSVHRPASFKVTERNSEIGKAVRGTPTSDAQPVAVLANQALMSQFFEIVISIWPLLAFGFGRLILRALVGEIWSQSGFDPNAPRIMNQTE